MKLLLGVKRHNKYEDFWLILSTGQFFRDVICILYHTVTILFNGMQIKSNKAILNMEQAENNRPIRQMWRWRLKYDASVI